MKCTFNGISEILIEIPQVCVRGREMERGEVQRGGREIEGGEVQTVVQVGGRGRTKSWAHRRGCVREREIGSEMETKRYGELKRSPSPLLYANTTAIIIFHEARIFSTRPQRYVNTAAIIILQQAIVFFVRPLLYANTTTIRMRTLPQYVSVCAHTCECVCVCVCVYVCITYTSEPARLQFLHSGVLFV